MNRLAKTASLFLLAAGLIPATARAQAPVPVP